MSNRGLRAEMPCEKGVHIYATKHIIQHLQKLQKLKAIVSKGLDSKVKNVD